jgi:hypothetical protein
MTALTLALASHTSQWQSIIILEIVDSKHNPVWTFPSSLTPLKDLLASVSYQVANVDNFIQALLNE